MSRGASNSAATAAATTIHLTTTTTSPSLKRVVDLTNLLDDSSSSSDTDECDVKVPATPATRSTTTMRTRTAAAARAAAAAATARRVTRSNHGKPLQQPVVPKKKSAGPPNKLPAKSAATPSFCVDLTVDDNDDCYDDDGDDDRKPAAVIVVVVDARKAPPVVASTTAAGHGHGVTVAHNHKRLAAHDDDEEESDLNDELAAVSRARHRDGIPRRCKRKATTTPDCIIDTKIDAADHALALRLQKEEDHALALRLQKKDHALALRLQKKEEQDEHFKRSKKDREDHALALRLQTEEQELCTTSKKDEEEQMHSSTTGKAWKFVEKVLDLHKELEAKHPSGITPVAVDDMVYTAERMLRAQEDFRNAAAGSKPTAVDMGYHYTRSENLTRIKTDGLMSKRERDANNIAPAKYNGSAYGDGIYTAVHESAYYASYGDVGIMVARMRGVESDFPLGSTFDQGNDSVTVNRNQYGEFTVLQTSKQCIPVLQFAASTIAPHPAVNAAVRNYHEKLLKIINEVFNVDVSTTVSARVPADVSMANKNPINSSVTLPVLLPTTATAAAAPTYIIARKAPRRAFGMPPPPLAVGIATITIANMSSTSGVGFHPLGTGASATAPSSSTHHPAVVSGLTSLPRSHRAAAGSGGGLAAATAAVTATKFAAALLPVITQIRLPVAAAAAAPIPVSAAAAASVAARKSAGISTAATTETLQYVAPPSLASTTQAASFLQVHKRLAHSILANDCAVCRDSLQQTGHGKVVGLVSCSHLFHRACIEQALSHSNNCPSCRKSVCGKPQGRMPSGTMIVTGRTTGMCTGHEPAGSITILYQIPSAAQKPYHDNPGQMHDSVIRVAYLPDTVDGNNLLKRLKYAFSCGLTFTVGVSMTTGRANSVTWASIHHKTSRTGGVYCHGFPDPAYFHNCNDELDALNVPPADDL